MLSGLGFTQFAYDWREKDVPTFDAEIEALKRHGIGLVGWWFPFDADDALAKATLETFRRHGVHPQLWVYQSQRNKVQAKMTQAMRVQVEAERIAALVRLAAPYGCPVELYNHNGWYGIMDNQLAMLDYLVGHGIGNVGLVYNFSHARDESHDDSVDFPRLWARIKAHVVAVNISGMNWDGHIVYPSQGDKELEMMRVIEDSGWRGPVGLIAEKGGDAEVTLRNYLRGLDWLADRLRNPATNGTAPRPVFD
jgi:sugar phosphate isomerase/epimerase